MHSLAKLVKCLVMLNWAPGPPSSIPQNLEAGGTELFVPDGRHKSWPVQLVIAHFLVAIHAVIAPHRSCVQYAPWDNILPARIFILGDFPGITSSAQKTASLGSSCFHFGGSVGW